jgi:hypothetical protein
MSVNGDYWVSVDDIDCIPRLLERLERAIQKPWEEYIPITIIHRAVLLAFQTHFEDRGILIPYEFYRKMKDLCWQLNGKKKPSRQHRNARELYLW